MKRRRGVIVVATAAFEPGFKGGGPIRSLVNLVQVVSSDFVVRIITKDRDIGDKAPFVGVKVGTWLRRSRAAVFYANSLVGLVTAFRKALTRRKPAVLYLNSFFHPQYSILPVMLAYSRAIRPRAIILAPRGEFSQGALAIRSRRKKLFIQCARQLGLHRNVHWHATSRDEAEDIQRVVGADARIALASNLTMAESRNAAAEAVEARRDPLKVIFLSRVSEKKNLTFALRVLSSVETRVDFFIAGPVEEKEYWHQCKRQIAELPEHIRVFELGPIKPDRVREQLAQCHLFFLPTLGENYGHAIVESLLSGVPVLISDRTPWRNLFDRGAGWDFSLDTPEPFARAIEQCAALGDSEYVELRAAAVRYAADILLNGGQEASLNMFSGFFTGDVGNSG